MPARGHQGPDPLQCEEYAYGLGEPDGIFVLKYRSAGGLTFGESRQDFLHQLYWSPDGLLSTLHGSSIRFVGPREVFWASRAIAHEVRAGDRQAVYRICLREVPPALALLRAGPAALTPEAAALIESIARPGCSLEAALAARRRIMVGLTPTPSPDPHASTGVGYALTVAHALSADPANPTRLDEWATRLRINPKTLQRDFLREFGISYTHWRTQLRLSAARVLLEFHSVTKVAHQVGYASPSAFIAAYARQFGHTPGQAH